MLRQLGVQANGEELTDKIVERFHTRAKHDQRLGIFPGHDEIVRSHPVGDVVSPQRGRGGEPLWSAALSRHDVNLGVAIVLRGERELRAVGGKMGKGGITGAAGEPPCDTALLADGVELTRIAKNDLLSVRGRETEETRGIGQFLSGGEGHQARSKKDDKREQPEENLHGRQTKADNCSSGKRKVRGIWKWRIRNTECGIERVGRAICTGSSRTGD